VGFFFPPLAGDPPNKPMNNERNIEAPESDPPEIRSENALLAALREVYLAAGLSPEHASRSARADYECNFQPVTPCAA
jgi:hypothetical protein